MNPLTCQTQEQVGNSTFEIHLKKIYMKGKPQEGLESVMETSRDFLELHVEDVLPRGGFLCPNTMPLLTKQTLEHTHTGTPPDARQCGTPHTKTHRSNTLQSVGFHCTVSAVDENAVSWL